MELDPCDRFIAPDPERQNVSVVPEWVWSLTWPVLILLGLIVIEFTADPMLATIIVCSKLAWRDVATAFWIRKRDPSPGRGKALFWFTLAYGTCKVMMWSLAVAVVLIVTTAVTVVVILPQFGQAGRAIANLLDDNRLAMALTRMGLVGALSFAPVVILTGIACLSAKWHRIRVWMDPSLDTARRKRSWPPHCNGTRNRVDTVLLISVAALVVGTLTGGMVVAVEWKLADPAQWLALAFAVIGLLSWIVGSGVLAQSPAECWRR